MILQTFGDNLGSPLPLLFDCREYYCNMHAQGIVDIQDGGGAVPVLMRA